MVHQADEYRPAPPPQADNRTDAQRAAEEAYRQRRAAQDAPQQRPPANQPAQSRPADPDPLATAQATLADQMGATPVEDQPSSDTQAVRALNKAARAAVQADLAGGGSRPRDAEQADQARKAITAGRAATDRAKLVQIVLYAHELGLLPLQVDGMSVGAELSAVLGTLPAVAQ